MRTRIPPREWRSTACKPRRATLTPLLVGARSAPVGMTHQPQKRPNAGKQLETCCHCPGRPTILKKMSEFTRVFLFFVATGLLPDTYAGAFREVCTLFLASWETLRLKYTCTRGRFGRSSCPRRKCTGAFYEDSLQYWCLLRECP